MGSSMAEWTKAELETLRPFEGATRQVGAGTVPMTREDYDAWIARAVGRLKDDAEP